ncbi:MAG: transcriptional regulator [Bacteroidales bacterium]|nr:transcriptional regulator [Bacteroidales bacterium]
MYLLKKCAILSLVLFTFATTHAQVPDDLHITPEINSLLSELDALLAQTSEINNEKTKTIDALRKSYVQASTPETRYQFANELYEQYSAFNSDSAIHYATEARRIANTLKRKDLVDDMSLNLAYVYSATGLLAEAAKELDSVDRNDLSDSMLWKYCDRALFLDTHRDQYMGVIDRKTAYSAVVDSLLQQVLPDLKPDDEHYFWFIGWGHLKDKSQAQEVIPLIKPKVDSSNMNNRSDAMNAWLLSMLSEYTGDYTSKLKYLILSAMADIRASNKEIASLQELAGILYELGDLDRANAYVTYSIACANDYRSRVRIGSLAALQEKTMTAIQQRSQRQDALTRHYLWGLIGILTVLVLALLFIMRQMQLLNRSRAEINLKNKELSAHIEELKATREELKQANGKLSEMYDRVRTDAERLAAVNYEKEEYIANIFAICSNYINKLDDFRKNIYRMIVAHRYDDMRELTKSAELSHSEIKELYATFDKIFLEIYPNFVEDFNSLLRPEERTELKPDGSLTTELRIYAVVRLGINDSVKIARFLHVSPQTVYNTRLRARNKAAGPKEGFADAVKSLGKPKF